MLQNTEEGGTTKEDERKKKDYGRMERGERGISHWLAVTVVPPRRILALCMFRVLPSHAPTPLPPPRTDNPGEGRGDPTSTTQIKK